MAPFRASHGACAAAVVFARGAAVPGLAVVALLLLLAPPVAAADPVTTLRLGDPSFPDAAPPSYVRSDTPLDFSISDPSGTGIRNTTYRVDVGAWVNYTATGSFTLGMAGEGPHFLEWHSEDNVGSVEAVKNADLFVDDTPPETTIAPAGGPFTAQTRFTLSAADVASGVARTEYRVDGGAWTPYAGGFSLPPGEHTVTYNSTDRVSNAEQAQTFRVTIEGSAPSILPLIVVSVASPVALLAILSLWSENLRLALSAPFVALWARLREEDIMANERRWMLRGYLAANPGANFAAIRADLDMAVGTLAYHLYVLETEGILRSWKDGRYRRYAPAGHRVADEKPRLADRLTDVELILLEKIRESPAVSQRELAKEMGVSQPAIHYHLSKMAAMGVVRMERRGLRAVYSTTCDPSRLRADRGAADGRT